MNLRYSILRGLLLAGCLLALAAQPQPGGVTGATGRAASSAASLMDKGDFRGAMEILQPLAASRQRGDPEIHIMLATCYLRVGDRQQAVQACERALIVYPNSPRLEKFYVSILRAATAPKDRRAMLKARLQAKPGSTAFMVGLLEATAADDPYSPEIEPLALKAVKLLPDDPELHYLYGRWACLNDRQKLAIPELTKALSLSGENLRAKVQIYTYLGISYDHLEQFDKADQAFRDGIALNLKLDRPDPGMLMEYVSFLRVQQRDAEAQETVMQVLHIAPSFGPAHLERANYLAGERKIEEAVAEGELALKYAGNDKTGQRAAHAFLARMYSVLGRTEQAQVHQAWIESH